MSRSTVQIGIIWAAVCQLVSLGLLAGEPASHLPPPPASSWAPEDSKGASTSAALRQILGDHRAWGEDLLGDQLAHIRLGTPGTLTDVGPMALDTTGAEFIGGDSRTLLVITAAGQLYSVNTTDAATSLIGTATSQGTEEFSGLAEDPISGILYASSTNCYAGGSSSLYTINPATAVATRIGTVTNSSCLVALGCNAAGQLFGVDVDIDMLVSISTVNGAGTLVGTLGFDANYSQGMDFDPDNDTCILFAYDGIVHRAQLRTCNTSTGHTSLYATIGGSTLSTFAAYGGAAIPGLFGDGFETGDTSRWSFATN